METIHDCPDYETLKKLWNAQLASGELDVVIRHLEKCFSCEETLKQLSQLEENCFNEFKYQQFKNLNWTEKPSGPLFQKIVSLGITDLDRDEIISRLSPSNEDKSFLGYLNHYNIQGVLGTGASSIVLEGFDSSLQRPVAIKVLRPCLAQDLATKERFSREARHLAMIRDEHIVSIHEIQEWNGLNYFVMPRLEGETLAQAFKNPSRLHLEVSQIAELGVQLASGLQILHHAGLIHRDIKPSNIWLEQHLREKIRLVVLDFGLVVDSQNTARGGFQGGTLNYMSPEQLAGKPLDKSTDIYSAGCVLFEMFTGSSPFQFQDKRNAFEYFESGKIPEAKAIRREIPEKINALLKSMLSVDLSSRIKDTSKVIKILEEFSTRNLKANQGLLVRRNLMATTGILLIFGLFMAFFLLKPRQFVLNSNYLHSSELLLNDVDGFVLHPNDHLTGVLRGKKFTVYRDSLEHKSLELPFNPGSFPLSDCGELIAFYIPPTQNVLIYSFPDLEKIAKIKLPDDMIRIPGMISKTVPKKFFYASKDKIHFTDLDKNLGTSESLPLPCKPNLASSDPRGRGIAVWSNENGGSLGIVSPVNLTHTFSGKSGRKFYAENINSDGAEKIKFCPSDNTIGVLSTTGWLAKINIINGYKPISEYKLDRINSFGFKGKELVAITNNKVLIEKTGLVEILKSNHESQISQGKCSEKNLAIHLADKTLHIWKWK